MENQERPGFAIETEKIYKSFEHEIDLIRECEPTRQADIKLKDVVVSAYVKTYDYILYLCSLTDYRNSFFQLPMLRGICEDLIALTYILKQTKEKQNYIIINKRYEELKKSLTVQRDFFEKYNRGQIVPPVINENIDISEIFKVHIDAGHVFEKAQLPTVYQMAEQTNLKHLYDFIYHATSKAVHFDIFTLLSTGWGQLDEKNGTMSSNFSHKHDYKHYYTFSLFYSSYLFLEQTNNFKTFLSLPDSIETSLSGLRNEYSEIDWPELVTFRQMNITPPSVVTKAMNRVLNNRKKD